MRWKHKFRIIGWVTTEQCVEVGILETNESLRDIWDILYQTFQDGSYKEGLHALEEKEL